MNKFTEQIQNYVGLQKILWSTLLDSISGDTGEFLSNVPKSGEVILSGRKWAYIKHGLGVCFTEFKTQNRIDFHRVELGSECFDAWGLSIYFGSLGNKGQKILNEYGMKTESHLDRIKHLLGVLEDRGLILKKGDAYELL